MIQFNTELDNYILSHSQPESELLYDLNRQTHIRMIYPRMLSGHLQGRMLSMISKMIQPENILEIGTYTGYSALCMAEGLKKGGKIVTIEKDDEIAEFANEYFQKSAYSDNIDLIVGDALEVIGRTKLAFDIVFIDADKKQYEEYYEQSLEKTKTGGYIIADNVLWSGKVIDKNESKDPDTKAILAFNSKIQHDDRVENVLFPIRDGLMIIRKK